MTKTFAPNQCPFYESGVSEDSGIEYDHKITGIAVIYRICEMSGPVAVSLEEACLYWNTVCDNQKAPTK